MATTTDIANRALMRIGVKTFDNAAESGPIAAVIVSLNGLYSTLLSKSVIRFSLDDIPEDAEEPLVDELAYRIRNDFAVPTETKVDLQSAQLQARADLYSMSEVKSTDAPAEILFY